MKYAVIADIHGNLPALHAVLADARTQGADATLFLGDYCMSCPFPEEVVQLIRRTPHADLIRGNQEDYLTALESEDPLTWITGQKQILYWCFRQLSPESRAFLHGLPARRRIGRGETALYLAHSSAPFIGRSEHAHFSSSKVAQLDPAERNHQALLADIQRRLAGDPLFQQSLADLPPGVYLFGHTHIQWHYRQGGHQFINPGSCGLPMDYEPGAPYTLVELQGPEIRVTERRIPYDIHVLTGAFHRSGQYQQARVWSEIMLREIEERREYLHFFLWYAEAYAVSHGDPVRPYSQETWEAAFRSWNFQVP